MAAFVAYFSCISVA